MGQPSSSGTEAGILGLRVLVTGAASGIGLATASELVSRGAHVVGVDLRSSSGLFECLSADLTQMASVEAAVATAVELLGGLDGVVSNAGIGASGTIVDNDDAEWRAVVDVNVMGFVRLMRTALPHLRRSSRASVVTTCSVVAEVGLPNRAVYTASKGALQALTISLAADLIAEGIRVNAVSPGTTDTPWVARLLEATDDPQSQRASLESRQPSGRLIEPREVAHAIAYLLDSRSSSTTGEVLHVDAGLTRLRVPPAQRVPQ
ncbi:SDR family NAD(P)-dependent oxidoreductase [Lysobacter korlensis]|uniref:SDR family NAD(P)-dependent oxidoreductase n=1 Tax=Lysobacter korlensis TaxID=553636 RepID=A0ABV6RT00_9GAMM